VWIRNGGGTERSNSSHESGPAWSENPPGVASRATVVLVLPHDVAGRLPHSTGVFLLLPRSMHAEIGEFDPTVRLAEDQD
jgi:hypothetical protein